MVFNRNLYIISNARIRFTYKLIKVNLLGEHQRTTHRKILSVQEFNFIKILKSYKYAKFKQKYL
jgi:hypothetical protein